MEKAFVVWQIVPVASVADDVAAFCRVKENNLTGQIMRKVKVNIVAPACRQTFAHAMAAHLFQRLKANGKQSFSVNAHEIASDVHFQHETRLRIVPALFQDMLPQTVNAVMCPPSFDATITILDESALKHFVGIVEIEVMHYTVAKMGGKHFAPLGVGDDEAFGRQGLVGA